ncbi:retrotransposon-related protein [Tanacetum coccineum]
MDVPKHKYPGKFLLLMTEEEDDMGVATRDGGEDAGKIGKGDVHVLIDNGSTHNFIHPDVVEKMCLPIKSTKAFKVYIGSGESLLCESVCSSVTLHMQGVVMEVDLYVLPMQGPDVVLGIQWLQNLGKVTHDYAHQTMEFTLLDTTYSLKGDDSLRMKKISLHQMQAMLDHDDVYGVYEVHHLSIETEVEEMYPTTLPPHRSIDHRIHLLPEIKPVNVRPYHYPHYQKEEMEKLANEMLSQAMVQKQIEEDKVRQLAIMNLAVESDNASTSKDDMRKAYEECNDIPQEKRTLIDTFFKEES